MTSPNAKHSSEIGPDSGLEPGSDLYRNFMTSTVDGLPERRPVASVGSKAMRRSGGWRISAVVRQVGMVVMCCLLTTTGFARIPEGPRENDPAPPSTTVNSIDRETILEISARIDDLVKSQLQAKQEDINPLASDEVFLRRAYLDIIGRIPTLDETNEFLNSQDASKRADLIDQLLDSYGYVSRQYNFWADVLRIQSRMSGGLTGVSYIDFVKDSLESNRPYDQFVEDLITSEGPNLERGNGAVGYYLRDRNMPEDNMSNTIRVFLGTRLECAQCHDHPFDKWTQRQYFEMVAFTGGIRYRSIEDASMYRDIRTMVRRGELPENERRILNRISQNLTYGVSGSGTGLARLPEGFLGDDGYEGEIVVGKTMFDGLPLVDAKIPPTTRNQNNRNRRAKPNAQQATIPGARSVNSREAYGLWLTDPANPRFAQVIANRLWKQALGIGLIEPVDIIEDNTVASNPELMEYLTTTMVDLNFDMKQYLRAIYNTQTYQAAAFNQDVSEPREFGFNGPIVRRMSAEQIWDSLLVLTVPETDRRSSQSQPSRYGALSSDPYENFERMTSMSAEELKQLVTDITSKTGQRNNRNSGSRMDRSDPEMQKLRAKRSQLSRQLKTARRQKNSALERELLLEQAKLVTDFRQRNQAGNFSRASEMPSPAPTGHFLREFGQSDREQIDNANTEPAVTQVLSMMNGYVEQRIARDSSSVLMQNVLATKSAAECTESIFLSMLNRRPTTQEARQWERDFKQADQRNDKAKTKEVYSDLIWTLANSNEFIFVK